MPNIHEEKIRILQKQLAMYDKKIKVYDEIYDIKPPEIMRFIKKRNELKDELDLLLDENKELKK